VANSNKIHEHNFRFAFGLENAPLSYEGKLEKVRKADN